MTSKYEELSSAIKEMPENDADGGELYDWVHDYYDIIKQALRKAESMDRLIEAAKGDMQSNERYIVPSFWDVAANETAKFIED